MMSNLVCYKLFHRGKREEVYLEPEILDAIKEIAKLEQVSVREICALISRMNHKEDSDMASAIRVFVCTYYRNLALVIPRDYVERSEPISENIHSLKTVPSK